MADKIDSLSSSPLSVSPIVQQGLTTTSITPLSSGPHEMPENDRSGLSKQRLVQPRKRQYQIIDEAKIPTTLFANSDIHMRQVLGTKKQPKGQGPRLWLIYTEGQ